MIVFRVLVALLPQLLFLLFAAGQLDMLGGWNHTESASGLLTALFVVAPLATGALLVVEFVRYRRRALEARGTRSIRALGMVGFAFVLFFEALAVNGLILTQARMH